MHHNYHAPAGTEYSFGIELTPASWQPHGGGFNLSEDDDNTVVQKSRDIKSC